MPTLLSPIILAVTRSSIGNTTPPVPPSPAGSANPTLDQVMGWFDSWVKAFDPALLGVEPEKPLYIYSLHLGIPLQDVVDVITPDIMDPPPAQGQNPTPHTLEKNTQSPPRIISSFHIDFLGIPTAVLFDEISVFVPDMVALEASRNYVPNALLMGMSVQLITAGGDLSASSLPLPVWLPGPLVGEPVWGDMISFGNKENSILPQEFITNYLGVVAVPDTPDPNKDPDHIGGQIRWYSIDKFSISDLEQIHFDLMDFLHSEKTAGTGQLAITLPDAIVPTMQKLRQAGDWIFPPIYWDDNCAEVYLPDKPKHSEKPGYMIIWRDDIPSRIIPFMDVLDYILEKLRELAKQIFQPHVNGQAAVVNIPIPVGKVMEIGLERLVDAANNLLASALGNQLTVQLAFKVVDVANSPGFHRDNIREVNDTHFIDGGYLDGFVPSMAGISSKKVAFRYKPEISATELSPEQAGAFSLQLSALISGSVALLNKVHTIPEDFTVDIGLPVVFQPEPVVIPTLAIFFYHLTFQGPALVMMDKGSGLFGKDADGNKIEIHLDTDTQGQFNDYRQNLLAKLNSIHTVLKVYQEFTQDKTVALLTDILGTFCSIGMSVVDTHGEIGNLGSCMIAHRQWPFSDITFHDSITSVVLIGVPYKYSKMVVKCYEQFWYNTQQNGAVLNLVMPDDACIAAIPNFKDLHSRHHLVLDNGSILEIPPPYGNPDEGQPGEPEEAFKDFNDNVDSIKFVRE